ncbi:SRPBCC family protein [Marinilabilia sp.]|uniref:SRPBCC family protein n=1 Tax=Marinilabilia sp. TaxID=2021252 RepID=UPI00345CF8CF
MLINSSPKKVWAILTDFENFPFWNPFITSIKGEVVPGKKKSVRIVPPGSRGMIIKPAIKTFNPNR